MEEPNVLNIPAYQRKRSINAKARNKPSYLETALDRATMATKKKTKNRKKTRARNTISKTALQRQILEEIPIQTVLPSQEIFPDPFLMEELPKKQNDFREMLSCGICEGYFDKIEVAIIKVTSPFRIGDSIIFEKQDGLFEQEIKSMQLNRKDITLATTGSEIGLKVYQKPIIGSQVYKVMQ